MPNFGVDKDIIATRQHWEATEKKMNHKFTINKPEEHPVDYKVNDFGLDEDIKHTASHLAAAEAKFGTWVIPKNQLMLDEFMQIEASREPLLSAGIVDTAAPDKHFPKAKWPQNYGIANIGVDHDVIASQTHEAAASAALGHTWVPKKGKDDKWILPHEDAEFKL